MTRPPRNIAHSVRARLAQRARDRGEDFQLVLQRYAAEGLLRRLAASAHRDAFILKGAMLYYAWAGAIHRPTRDIDLLGYGSASPDDVAKRIREICTTAVPDDGLRFREDVTAAAIMDETEYGGVRVRMTVALDTVELGMHVDVGFGDAVSPSPAELEYPALLGGAGPRIRAYPRETVVAEKFHAMVLRGEGNSRMKDFHDLWVLPSKFGFTMGPLGRAVAATFERRATPVPGAAAQALPLQIFAQGPLPERWRSYRARGRVNDAPADFGVVGEALHVFLGPVLDVIAAERDTDSTWEPGGPWR